jgi:hypothetical protein
VSIGTLDRFGVYWKLKAFTENLTRSDMSRVPPRPLLLVLAGIVLIVAPVSLFQSPPEYRFTVTSPENATMDPTGNVSYENLSTDTKRIFRTALNSEDGEYIVHGQENAPDDIQYLSDYYPAPGVYNVSYQGEYYVLVAQSPGVNIAAGLTQIAVRIFGVITILIGIVSLLLPWSDRLLEGQTLTAGLLIGTGLVAPWLFDETPLFLLLPILVFLAFAHLLAGMYYAIFEVGQSQPKDPSR